MLIPQNIFHENYIGHDSSLSYIDRKSKLVYFTTTPGNTPSPKPMLTKIYDVIQRHNALINQLGYYSSPVYIRQQNEIVPVQSSVVVPRQAARTFLQFISRKRRGTLDVSRIFENAREYVQQMHRYSSDRNFRACSSGCQYWDYCVGTLSRSSLL